MTKKKQRELLKNLTENQIYDLCYDVYKIASYYWEKYTRERDDELTAWNKATHCNELADRQIAEAEAKQHAQAEQYYLTCFNYFYTLQKEIKIN